eukprot:TRINITY_DN4299_c0_g1_i1.p3 TRINITY_DN4299_c0_g1~~TRINITY_DN4299_c0_g1_i1.p3  ORF type:complete len:117 (+),score=25.30 TRINITY_DN4299_c0_g1_i1:1529-1879(+)
MATNSTFQKLIVQQAEFVEFLVHCINTSGVFDSPSGSSGPSTSTKTQHVEQHDKQQWQAENTHNSLVFRMLELLNRIAPAYHIVYPSDNVKQLLSILLSIASDQNTPTDLLTLVLL